MNKTNNAISEKIFNNEDLSTQEKIDLANFNNLNIAEANVEHYKNELTDLVKQAISYKNRISESSSELSKNYYSKKIKKIQYRVDINLQQLNIQEKWVTKLLDSLKHVIPTETTVKE